MANTGGITHFSAVNPKFDIVTAVSNAATLNTQTGVVTTDSISGSNGGTAGSTYALTLTNARCSASSYVLAAAYYGSATAGTPIVVNNVSAAGSVVLTIQNAPSASTINGTLKVAYWVLNPTSA